MGSRVCACLSTAKRPVQSASVYLPLASLKPRLVQTSMTAIAEKRQAESELCDSAELQPATRLASRSYIAPSIRPFLDEMSLDEGKKKKKKNNVLPFLPVRFFNMLCTSGVCASRSKYSSSGSSPSSGSGSSKTLATRSASLGPGGRSMRSCTRYHNEQGRCFFLFSSRVHTEKRLRGKRAV